MATVRDKLGFQPSARLVAILGVMIAIIFVATYFPKIPIPGGYVHLGDTMVYFAAFIFGPIVGALAAGIGMALADLSAGYGSYAPGTFVIHGLQGLVAGIIAWRGGLSRMILAVIAGGLIVVGGYFIYDYAVLDLGLGTATADAGFNVGQVLTGAVVGILLVLAIRQAYPPITTWSYRRAWREES